MGGRGANSGRIGSYTTSNKTKLSAAGNTHPLFQEVKKLRITGATAGSANFEGAPYDWRGDGDNRIWSSDFNQRFIIEKSPSSGTFVLIHKRGGNQAAIDSSRNIESLIKKANKKLKI